MFRLIKLAMYALVGYVLYELYQGMTTQAQGQDTGRGDRRRQEEISERGGEAITGPGVGRRMQTLDSNGGSVPHRVGRGVTTT